MAVVINSKKNKPKAYVPSSVTLIGDSLQGQSGPFTTVTPGVSTVITKPDIGWGGWMARFSKGAINVIANLAVIGYTTEQILATVPAAIATGAQAVIVNGMTNDIVAGWPIARTKEALSAIFKQLNEAGIQIIMATAPPLYKLTDVEGGKFIALNEWIRAQARDYGAPVIDVHAMLVDPLSVTGYAKAGVLQTDNTHLNPKTARACGLMAWNTVSYLFPDRSVHSVSVLERKLINPVGTNLLNYALMSGTAGTGLNIGSIPANSVASGMQVVSVAPGPTVTPSLVARADGFGFDQIADVTAGVVAGSTVQIRSNDTAYTRAAPGDILQGEMWVSTQNMVGVYRLQLSLTCRIDGVLYQSIDCSSSGELALGSVQVDQSGFANLVFKTEPFQLPATGAITSLTLTLDVYFSEANGTIKLAAGRPLIRTVI